MLYAIARIQPDVNKTALRAQALARIKLTYSLLMTRR